MKDIFETKTITIKPVARPKFSGQSAYSNTKTSLEGAQLGKGGYKTGLTKEEEKEFEKLLNLPSGTLSKSSKYWATVLNLSLPNDKAYTFTIDSLEDYIKYKVILNHSGIANSENTITPASDFYIEDIEARAKVEEKTINYKMEANEIFTQMTGEERKGFLKLYGKKGVNNMSDIVIKTQLYKEVENDPQRFILLYRNPDIKDRIEIEEMLESGVLTKKGQYYSYENEVIGNSVEACIAFFKDYKNQSLKIAMKANIQKNKKNSDKDNSEE